MEKPSNITINYGESYEAFKQNHTSMKKSGAGNKKYGYLFFYESSWSPHNAGAVTFNINNLTLTIKEVVYFIATISSNEAEKDIGVHKFYLQSGITAEDWISYDEARLKFHDILQGLLDKGWKRALRYSTPRYINKSALHHKQDEKEYTNKYYILDPEYLLNLDEWKSLEQGTSASNIWALHYNNQVFIEIKLQYEPHKTDADKAAYLLFIKIRNAENEAQSYFRVDDKETWQEKWLEKKKKFALARQEAEIEGIKKGYAIDVHYLDYQIPPGEIQSQAQLDESVKSLTFKNGATVPRSGYYEATLPDYNPRYGTLKANPRRYVKYQQGDTFRQFGLGETTEPKIRWVFIVDSLPESVDETQ